MKLRANCPGGIALFSRFPKPGHGNRVVLHDTSTVLVPLAELGLRLGVAHRGPRAQSSEG